MDETRAKEDIRARRKAGQGFCLVMRLANPSRLPELLEALKARKVSIETQLERLKYVHYSRFVPIVDRGVLLIVTEFDGVQEDYVMDFASVLDAEFSFILSYMEGAPPLPVSRHPEEFYSYVERNARLFPTEKEDPFPFSAYRGRSVLDILGADVFEDPKGENEQGSGDASPEPSPRPAPPKEKVEWSEVQANVVQGLRACHALHVGLSFKPAADDSQKEAEASAAAARDVVKGLAELVTSQAAATEAIKRKADKKSAMTINVGITYEGLAALGVPSAILGRFPTAYREGPAKRDKRLGDIGKSASANWKVCGPGQKPLHVLLSVWAGGGTAEQLLEKTRALVKPYLRSATVEFEQPASALDGQTVHFGYRDNISQPQINAEGLEYKKDSPEFGLIPVGDILLGASYGNSRSSSPIADLPVKLAGNATYAAFRVIEQHVDAFDDMLKKPEISPELALEPDKRGKLIAAKLLGRWPDGTPLSVDGKEPPATRGEKSVGNDFDFWKVPSKDDRSGSACPFGSHIRRMNPRAGAVVGLPGGRRIVRRAMPYGPAQGDAPHGRGLVGLFFCADLHNQFEFIQHAWANGDVSAPGLAGSVDPFIGVREDSESTPFVFQHDGKPYTLQVPRLTTIVGSAYLLMPSKPALAWLAGAGWRPEASKEIPRTTAPPPTPIVVSDAPGGFNVGDPRFTQMPHRFYANWRKQKPVIQVGPPYGAAWVLSFDAVKEALERDDVFVKPGKGRGPAKPSPFAVTAQLDDGLFFQDRETHRTVKGCLRPKFDAIAVESKVRRLARDKADELLVAAAARGVFDVVSEFAQPLTVHVFMSLALPPVAEPGAEPSKDPTERARIGLPFNRFTDPRAVLDAWVRKALMGHDENAPRPDRLEGGAATFALRGWLHAFLQGEVGTETIFGAIKQCPAHANNPDALANTALHFALGGYLSTEFLITTGVYNLLTTRQWSVLRDDRNLMGSAVEEMLRFDAPFMMADRCVEKATEFRGLELEPQSLVTLVYGSANRDPAVFGNDADEFDIRRFPEGYAAARSDKPPPHFAFGWREYDCIGQHVARWTASTAFNALLDRFPDARLGEVGPWLTDPYYRSLKRLTITV